MMIEPQRHEHRQAHGRAQRRENGDDPRAAVRPREAAGDEAKAQHQREEGQQRRDRAGPAVGRPLLHEQAEQQHQPGDRQVYEARPVDVRPARRIEPVLAQVEPALPGQPVLHLQIAHIVVGIAKREPVYRLRLDREIIDRDAEPGEEGQPFPVVVRPEQRADGDGPDDGHDPAMGAFPHGPHRLERSAQSATALWRGGWPCS